MTASGDARTDAEIEELCRLLLGLDRARLLAALERLEDRGAFTDWQSRSLGDAMRLALANDPKFAENMGDLIGKGVHATVERDASAFGRALAPAMGPAIRNAVRLMLQGLIQSIETTLDQRLSLRSLKWRVEAWRTGSRFAEVVFRHTLLYRVEHLFLVHREGGVQLLHASPPGVIAREPDLIAAMLTAIQDFVGDAFAMRQGDTLTSFSVGDLLVAAETGQHAVLAAVVRGKPPATLRLQLREVLDSIEASMGRRLHEFDGDVDPFEVVRPQLESCLVQSQLPGNERRGKKRRWLPWALLGAGVLGLVWLTIGWIVAAQISGRFETFLAELRREPGVVVTAVETTDAGWIVRGLRDPLGRPLDDLTSKHSIGTKVEFNLQPYHALLPRFVLARVTAALAPPTTVTVGWSDDRLMLAGRADHSWCVRAPTIARAVPGVEVVDTHDLEDIDDAEWQAAAANLRAELWPVAALRSGAGTGYQRLIVGVDRLQSRGRVLGRPTALRATLLLPSGDDTVDGEREAHALAGQLRAALGIQVQIVATESAAGVAERMLRLEAQAP